MALYDITFINGVTKVETANGFRYDFLLEKIETFTDGNYMVRESRTNSKNEVVYFSNIPDKMGATNIEGYVDAMANKGAYSAFDSISDESAGRRDKVTQMMLSNIAGALIDIKFLLAKLNE